MTGAARDMSGNLLATYRWLADGSGKGCEYAGSLVYKYVNGELQLESTGFGGGRIVVSEVSSGSIYTSNYYITDHLGSTRAIYDGAANIVRSDFLPFGTKWANGQAPSSRYQFTGYEDQEFVDNKYMNAGARLYNGRIFNGSDPLAEKRPWESPYLYCGGNPVNHIDPNGMDWYKDVDGTIQYSPNVTSQLDLQRGQVYIGITYEVKDKKGTVIADYKADGSIMFSREADGYSRIWNNTIKTGKEEMGVITEKGVLVLPSYANSGGGIDLANYGYSVQNGNVVDARGTSYKTMGTVHTHPSGGGPSTYTGNGHGDLGFASYHTPYKPVFVLQVNEQKSISLIVAAPNTTRMTSDFLYTTPTLRGANVDDLVNGDFSLRLYTKQHDFKKLLWE